MILLQIEDSGPGIPESALPQLFDPFYRVDSSRTRDTGGVGLGLSIVKTCVESCGGTVACENRRPSGLRVILRLPAGSGS
jgi:two-component system sensor histidine kinase CpxA